MRVSGHTRRNNINSNNTARPSVVQRCIFQGGPLLLSFMAVFIWWMGTYAEQKVLLPSLRNNHGNGKNNNNIQQQQLQDNNNEQYSATARTTSVAAAAAAKEDPRAALCQSSAFEHVETPLYIKWEEWEQRSPLDFYVIQLGGNTGLNRKGGDPVWEYVRPCQWRGAILEPVPATFDKLQQNYADVADRIQTLNMAVSNQTGTMSLKGMNEMARMVPLGQGRGEIQVKTLADLWAQLQPQRVDALVVDVEGHEVQCLADQDMPSPKPRYILFEIKQLNEQERQRIDDALKRQGYIHRADLKHKDKKAIENNDPPGDRLYSLPPPMVPAGDPSAI